MKFNYSIILLLLGLSFIQACQPKNSKENDTSTKEEKRIQDSIEHVQKLEEEARKKPITAAEITLNKALEYDKHTLEDTYPYEDTTRFFNWEKIKEKLAYVENFQRSPRHYGILQNRKNKNKEAPLVKNWKRDAYKRVSDTLGVEKWQGIPLYELNDLETPVLYGRDGWLVSIKNQDTTTKFSDVDGISFEGNYKIPSRYILPIGDTVTFHRIAFVDLDNQNICTIEQEGKGKWKVLSMNPATSGQHKPPYAMETPYGMFVIQEKKSKMYYLRDGTSEIHGYAPYASRFTNGAYIHGVPVQSPNGKIIEYSWSLGTIPRSHMCVRNASSHAKFVFDWAKKYNALVIVI